ncbi:MAG: tetratricopeptide repeat protein [Pyrinomonadaceae bacterium]
MNQKLLYAALGLVVGAFAGFLFATSADRRELESLRAQMGRAGTPSASPKSAGDAGAQQPPPGASPSMPTEAEMRDIIAKADARADDGKYQFQVGQGVYMYSLAQNSPALMPEAIRLLKRAEQSDPKNYQTLLLLGNAHFALGQEGDAKQYDDARGYYQKALATKPDDANLHALLGMTYYFASPSDPQRAIAEYRKSLAKDPRHEMALQNIASALIATGATQEAEHRISELETVNPNNNALNNLRAQLAQAKNAGVRK